MGLQTEFPIIICNLTTGTDAIIGTDVLVTVVALVITRGRARIGWAPSDDSVSEAGS